MKPFIASISLLSLLLLAGCKGGADSAVVGKWSAAGQTFEFKEDKTFSTAPAPSLGGKWTVAENVVTVAVETIDGKPKDQAIDDQVKQAMAMAPKGAGAPTKAQIDEIAKKAKEQLSSMKMTLAEDKKTMSLANPNPGAPAVTLTKEVPAK